MIMKVTLGPLFSRTLRDSGFPKDRSTMSLGNKEQGSEMQEVYTK